MNPQGVTILLSVTSPDAGRRLKFFTDTLSNKFVTKHQLKRVATIDIPNTPKLPCAVLQKDRGAGATKFS